MSGKLGLVDILDRYIPPEHSLSSHRVEIDAPAERIWESLLNLDIRESPLIRLLFRFRGLSEVSRVDDFQDLGFTFLERATDPPGAGAGGPVLETKRRSRPYDAGGVPPVR